MGTIRGTFCEEKKAPRRVFDPRSFRWKKSGRAWLLVGCPQGSWQPKKKACAVGMKAYIVLRSATGRCAVGTTRIHKGV